jgi:Pentapeptide repeats (8 copies)
MGRQFGTPDIRSLSLRISKYVLDMSEDTGRIDLRADCGSCVALCCVAPGFEVSADFPIHKPAGEVCPNLTPDYRCRIHDRLRPNGFYGCAAFDCFGAGQRTTRAFEGRTWRSDQAIAHAMFQSFGVFRLLHEILWYLEDALDRLATGTLRDEVCQLRHRTQEAAKAVLDDRLEVDAGSLQSEAAALLERVSRALRGHEVGPVLRGADLAGQRLRAADLRRADLRGASLIRTDLRGADLQLADLLGADLRGADLRGAKLSDAIFVTQVQVQAAIVDHRTTLPPTLVRPPGG